MSEMKNLGFEDDPRKSSNLNRVTSVEDLENRSWDRDSIEQRFRDVVNAHDTIVNIVSDIQSQIDNLDSKDDIESEHDSFYENVSKVNGRPKYHPDPAFQVAWDYVELYQRESRWMAELMELHRFANRKFKAKAEMLLEENRSAQVHDKLLDHMDEKIEDKLDRKFTKAKTEIVQHKNDIENVAHSIREERRGIDRRLERVAELEGKLDFQNSLEQFVGDHGIGFTIDQNTLEKDQKVSERKEAAESSADNLVEDDEDSDDGFSVDEAEEEDDGDDDFVVEDSPDDRSDARKELIEKWDDEFEMMTQQQIADALGKTQGWVSQVKNEEGLK